MLGKYLTPPCPPPSRGLLYPVADQPGPWVDRELSVLDGGVRPQPTVPHPFPEHHP